VCIKCWSEKVKRTDYWQDRCLQEDKVRIDLREIGWEDMDRMHLAKDRDQWQVPANRAMKFWVQKRAVNFLTS
jgi:hypothetical protein